MIERLKEFGCRSAIRTKETFSMKIRNSLRGFVQKFVFPDDIAVQVLYYLTMRNWKSYNKSLIRRGQILIDTTIAELEEPRSKQRGRLFKYSTALIFSALILKLLFKLHPIDSWRAFS